MLNGVNLNVLGRRDPALYGGLSLSELESQIYEWAQRARLPACAAGRRTSEGAVRRLAPRGARLGRRRRSSTRARGRTTAGRSATRSSCSGKPVVEVHLSNVDEREEWRRISVISDLVRAPRHRQGPGRIPRGARVPGRPIDERARRPSARARSRSRCSSRTGVNVRYLTGFDELERGAARRAGARAALHRLPLRRGGPQRARGVEFVEYEARHRVATLGAAAERAASASRRTRPHVRSYEALGDRRARARAAHGLVEGLRAVKDEDELARDPRGDRDQRTRPSRGSPRSAFVGRTERELAWRMEHALPRARAPTARVPDASSPPAPNGANAARGARRPRGRGGADRRRRRRRVARRLLLGLHAHVRCRASSPTSCARRTTSACARSSPGLDAVRPGVTRRRRGRGRARRDRGRGLRRAVRPRPRPRRRPGRARGAARSTESTDTLAAGNVVTVEPGVYLPGRGGIRIEDLVVVRDDGPEVLTPFTKELVTLA